MPLCDVWMPAPYDAESEADYRPGSVVKVNRTSVGEVEEILERGERLWHVRIGFYGGSIGDPATA